MVTLAEGQTIDLSKWSINMALKQYKPTSPSRRQLVTIDRSELYSGGPIKSLTRGQSKSGGRNNTGRITAWQRGGGHKKKV